MGRAPESAGLRLEEVASGQGPIYRLGSPLPFAGEFELAIMIEVVEPKRCMGRTEFLTCTD